MSIKMREKYAKELREKELRISWGWGRGCAWVWGILQGEGVLLTFQMSYSYGDFLTLPLSS